MHSLDRSSSTIQNLPSKTAEAFRKAKIKTWVGGAFALAIASVGMYSLGNSLVVPSLLSCARVAVLGTASALTAVAGYRECSKPDQGSPDFAINLRLGVLESWLKNLPSENIGSRISERLESLAKTDSEIYNKFFGVVLDTFPILEDYFSSSKWGICPKILAVEKMIDLLKSKGSLSNDVDVLVMGDGLDSAIETWLSNPLSSKDKYFIYYNKHLGESGHFSLIYISKKEGSLPEGFCIDSLGGASLGGFGTVQKLREQKKIGNIYVYQSDRQADHLSCSTFAIRDLVTIARDAEYSKNIMKNCINSNIIIRSDARVQFFRNIPLDMLKSWQSIEALSTLAENGGKNFPVHVSAKRGGVERFQTFIDRNSEDGHNEYISKRREKYNRWILKEVLNGALHQRNHA